jgi:hypothetical protein
MSIVYGPSFLPCRRVEWSAGATEWVRAGYRKQIKAWRSDCLKVVCEDLGLRHFQRYNFSKELNRLGAEALPLTPRPVLAPVSDKMS